MANVIRPLAFWLAAATLVAAAHRFDTPLGAIAALVAIFAVAFVYTHLCARRAGASHALAIGIAWLVLAIVAEMAMTAHLGHPWYALLGTPAHALLRNLFLFAWVFAPVVFAQHEVDAQ